MNTQGDQDASVAALHPEITIERCGFAAQRGQVVQIINGLAAARQWLAMTRSVVEFSCDVDSAAADGQRWSVRYSLTAPDDFVGGGLWQFRFTEDHRLLWLRHQPDELRQPEPAASTQ